MEEKQTTNKRDPWPTHLFDCCSGGKSLCLWGFLCPLCLQRQEHRYSLDLANSFSSWNHSIEMTESYVEQNIKMTESQLERFPPWSCRGVDCVVGFGMNLFVNCCLCLYGFEMGYKRHVFESENFEFYCSSRPACCCFDCGCYDDISIEDCLIGYCCCCCSVIQLTMVNEERFRMQSKVEGNVNIKRAQ